MFNLKRISTVARFFTAVILLEHALETDANVTKVNSRQNIYSQNNCLADNLPRSLFIIFNSVLALSEKLAEHENEWTVENHHKWNFGDFDREERCLAAPKEDANHSSGSSFASRRGPPALANMIQSRTQRINQPGTVLRSTLVRLQV